MKKVIFRNKLGLYSTVGSQPSQHSSDAQQRANADSRRRTMLTEEAAHL